MKQYRIKKVVSYGSTSYHVQNLVVWFWGFIKFWHTPGSSNEYYTGYNTEWEAREAIVKECAENNYEEIIPVEKPCYNHLPIPLPPGADKTPPVAPPARLIKEGTARTRTGINR